MNTINKTQINSTLTQRQKEILEFIISHIEQYGYPPSIPEIQEKFSFKSPNAVSDHLEALERKGYITRRPHKSRGIEVLIQSKSEKNDSFNGGNVAEVPIIGRVSAGTPILAEENLEGTLFVDRFLVRNPKGVFALRVQGESMVNAGILDGDFVLVRQQPVAEQGEIVVALIEDEATVKRFYKDKNKIKLKPENDMMKPIVIGPQDSSVRIIGKVVGVIRKFDKCL
ncbi:MAG: repressor LexA [Candidatus Omnitrophica bacterium 4484_171]|nr:MAG: repressor LexA [Candidatus Omnitrophica bacterium 4484_171]